MNRTQPIIKRQQQGSITVASAIVLPVLVVFIGLALTYSFALTQQTQLGNASESAAMFLALRDADDEARNLPAAQAIVQQFNGLQNVPQSNVQLTHRNSEYRINTQQQARRFSQHKLAENVMVNNTGAASANSKVGGQFDIVLVLDLSSSVNGNVSRVKREISNVVDELQAKFGDGNVRMSLVPFSFYPSIENADWLPESKTHIQCVDGHSFIPGSFGQVRSDDQTTANEVFYTPDQLNIINVMPRPLDTTYKTEDCPEIGTVPLTEHLDEIKQQVERFQSSNTTTTAYSHAVIFGARMLSENWLPLWRSDIEYRSGSQKVMFIIGDGADTGSHGDAFRYQIDFGLCNNIRANDIDIYGLRVGNYRVGSNMERCIGSFENMSDITDFTTLINKILTDAGVGNAEHKIKLVP